MTRPTMESLDAIVQDEIMPRVQQLRRYFHPELEDAEDAAEQEAREHDEKKAREE